MRDRAYRRAHRVVQVVLAAFLVAAWAGPRPVTFSGYRWQVVLTGLAWAALVPPTVVVVAWTEPVNPYDPRPALAGPGQLLVIGRRVGCGWDRRPDRSWHTA